MERRGKERKGRRGCVQWEFSITLGSVYNRTLARAKKYKENRRLQVATRTECPTLFSASIRVLKSTGSNFRLIEAVAYQ